VVLVGVCVAATLAVAAGCSEDPGAEACVDCAGDTGSRGDRGRGEPGDGGAGGEDGADDGGANADAVADTGASDLGGGDSGAADARGGDAAGGGDGGGGSRTGVLRPDPASIFQPHPGAGGRFEQIVRVFNETNQTVVFERVEVESGSAGFSIEDLPTDLVRAPGGGLGFRMVYVAPSAADAIATLRVHYHFETSGTPVSESLAIPVTIATKVAESACVNVTPTNLAFGTVRRGSAPVTRTFTVTNCGAAPFNLLRLDRGRVLFLPTPSSFQWTTPSPLPAPLTAGESVTVSVTYTAGRAGLESGSVNVITNVTGSETTTVRLSATAEPPPISELDVHLVLDWDTDGGSDVDFHFYPESSELFSCDDCYFSNMSPDWGAAGDIVDNPFLDYDDLEGPGPENINVDELPAGTYVIAVHYYSDTGSGSSGDGGSFGSNTTNATVRVYLGGVLADTFGPVYLDRTNRTWNVARLEWPAGTLTELGDTFIVSAGDYDWCSGGGLF
jgi:hypothetical protein